MAIKPLNDSLAELCGEMLGFGFDTLRGSVDINGEVGGIHLINTVWSAVDETFISIGEKLPNIMDSFKSVGYAIAMAFFLVQLLELAMSERMTLELFIKFFSKIVVAIAAIFYSDQLLTYIINFGAAFNNFLKDAVNFNDFFKDAGSVTTTVSAENFTQMFKDIGENSGAISWILFLLITVIATIALLIFGVVMSGMVVFYLFSCMLELIIRGILLPIALALLADDGWRGAGGRYIKKFIGVACQRAIITIMCYATNILMQKFFITLVNAATGGGSKESGGGAFFTFSVTPDNIAASLTGIFYLLIAALLSGCIALAGIGAMNKSIEYSNEVFGA